MKCHLPEKKDFYDNINATIHITQSNLEYLTKNVNRFKDGEIAYITDLNKYVIYRDNQWIDLSASKEVQIEGKNGIEMNVYDLNKQVISQLPIPQDQILFEETLNKFYSANIHSDNFMLLCKDISYYTIFQQTNNSQSHFITFGEAVLNCANDVGNVITVDYMENTNTVEIWVRTYIDQSDICMVLFDCDDFIVTFKE